MAHARSRSLVTITTSIALAACGGGQATAIDAAHAGSDGALPPLDAFDPKAAPCASTFGSDLAPAFGRFDGTILAVVPPGDETCALPNSTHLVLQATIAGVAYRLVVDVLSDEGDPNVYRDEIDAPLVGSAWSEGWHTDIPLDYVTNLGVQSTAFTSTPEDALVAAITAELELGAHVSVFATSGSDEPNSAHLVHRNLTNADGAIVISPDASGSGSAGPHWILMRFDEQSF